MTGSPQDLLRAMFHAAVEAARPENIVPQHLPSPPKGRTIVLGGGKASAAMAKAVEDTGRRRSKASSSRATVTPYPVGGSRSSRKHTLFQMLQAVPRPSAS